MLSQVGAPAPGLHNLGMLIAWSHGEDSPNGGPNPFAGNNPLATTWESATPGGCWSCNANGCFVRCFATEAEGATAIADTLKNGAYPTILVALRDDWTLCQWQCSSGVRAQLGTWGTGTAWLGTCPGGGCGGPPPTCVPACVPPAYCNAQSVCVTPASSASAGIGLLLVAGMLLGAYGWEHRERLAALATTPSRPASNRAGGGFV